MINRFLAWAKNFARNTYPWGAATYDADLAAHGYIYWKILLWRQVGHFLQALLVALPFSFISWYAPLLVVGSHIYTKEVFVDEAYEGQARLKTIIDISAWMLAAGLISLIRFLAFR
jgi:hypothetical protein